MASALVSDGVHHTTTAHTTIVLIHIMDGVTEDSMTDIIMAVTGVDTIVDIIMIITETTGCLTEEGKGPAPFLQEEAVLEQAVYQVRDIHAGTVIQQAVIPELPEEHRLQVHVQSPLIHGEQSLQLPSRL